MIQVFDSEQREYKLFSVSHSPQHAEQPGNTYVLIPVSFLFVMLLDALVLLVGTTKKYTGVDPKQNLRDYGIWRGEFEGIS